jgi:hypothetical protein
MTKKTKRSRANTSADHPEEARWTGAVLPSPTGKHIELICEYPQSRGQPKLRVLVRHEDVARLADSIGAAMGETLPELDS